MRNNKSVILVVDDEIKIQDIIIDILRYKGYHVEGVSTGNEALEFLGDHNVDLIFLDLKLPDIDGSELIHTIKLNSPLTPVVIISAYGDIPTAVKTTQLGAATFLEKPLDASAIIETVDVLLKHSEKIIKKENLKLEHESRFGMIGISPAITNVFGTIEKVASTNASVFIKGESGTGKELVAKAIHNQSSRKQERMVRVNCAAIPNDLIESELFGHKKGAFTGAMEDKKGRFELADKSTLFLDEIADINLLTQSKVLRVLQEKEFEPIGGTETIKTDMRVISATNKNLDREVAEGWFRQDLFFRLNVINIQIPPLKDRKEDIPYLVEHYKILLRRVQ